MSDNIFTRKMPERLSNVVLGLLFIIIAFPLAFFVYVIIFTLVVLNIVPSGIINFDLPFNPTYIIPAIVFLIQVSYGIYTMVRPTKKLDK